MLLAALAETLLFLLLHIEISSFESSSNENEEIHFPITIGSEVKEHTSRSSTESKSLLVVEMFFS